MNHKKAVSKAFPSEFEAADHLDNIASDLDRIEEELRTKRAYLRVDTALEDEHLRPSTVAQTALRVEVLTALVEQAQRHLLAALRSHGQAVVEAYKAARAS